MWKPTGNFEFIFVIDKICLNLIFVCPKYGIIAGHFARTIYTSVRVSNFKQGGIFASSGINGSESSKLSNISALTTCKCTVDIDDQIQQADYQDLDLTLTVKKFV